MKKSYIVSAITTILGLFIALGPHLLFKVCFSGCCGNVCNFTAFAEVGVGLFIAAAGLVLAVYSDPKIQIGLLLGVFFAGIISLLIPHALIGGCGGMTMDCRRVAFPALTVEGALVVAFSSFMLAVHLIPGKQGAK